MKFEGLLAASMHRKTTEFLLDNPSWI